MHLERILKTTRESVSDRKGQVRVSDLERRASEHVPRGFARALRAQPQRGPAIIAELKKASPSKGLIRENFDAAALAQTLERAGATALSVLTDEPFFRAAWPTLRQRLR